MTRKINLAKFEKCQWLSLYFVEECIEIFGVTDIIWVTEVKFFEQRKTSSTQEHVSDIDGDHVRTNESDQSFDSMGENSQPIWGNSLLFEQIERCEVQWESRDFEEQHFEATFGGCGEVIEVWREVDRGDVGEPLKETREERTY